MLWIEIVAFKGDVRIRGGQQGKPKPLAGAEFEDALGMEGVSWRAADDKRRECHVAGRGLSIETRGVAEVRNIAAGPVHWHAPSPIRCEPDQKPADRTICGFVGRNVASWGEARPRSSQRQLQLK
jgi:hypothetical protein